MLVPHGLVRVVGALLAASLITQAALGWVFGLNGAWVTVSIAAALLGVLAIADSRLGESKEEAEAPYDTVLCAVAGIVIVGAVACLYLPIPWGGLAAAAVVLALVITLRLSDARSKGSVP